MALDTFSETSLLSITKKDGTDREFSAIIETFECSGGEKGFESVSMISGGRRKRFSPQEDLEVTIEGYALVAGTDTGALGLGFFDLMHTEDTSNPVSISVDHVHDEFRLVVMNTDSTSITAATAATTSGDKAIRMIFQNGHFTTVDSSFSDNVLKFSITFKCPPFDASNSANVTYESTDGTAAETLSALTGTYTS